MTKYLHSVGLCIAMLAFTSTAGAQTLVPDRGMFAAGVDVGAAVPTDDELGTAPSFGGHVEYYVTPRVSLRPSVSFSSPQVGPESDTSMDHARIGFDAVYNWERGRWHPFVGAGLGIHRQDIEEHDFDLADGTTLGLSLLGGIEYFASRSMAVKGEVGYRPADSLDGWPAPSSVAFTLGLKWYR
jgi:hypothetical protein